jgi:hypothetical protein
MSEIGRIVEQLRQGHEGEGWHGPSVGEALAGVTAAGAARRPILYHAGQISLLKKGL